MTYHPTVCAVIQHPYSHWKHMADALQDGFGEHCARSFEPPIQQRKRPFDLQSVPARSVCGLDLGFVLNGKM
jgi:hypothetical protein